MNKSQVKKVEEYLKSGNSITQLEAIEKYQALRLSAIIYILRHEKGMRIMTQKCKNKNGGWYARYVLVKSKES